MAAVSPQVRSETDHIQGTLCLPQITKVLQSMLIRMLHETFAGLHTCPARAVQTIHMVSNLPHIAVRLPGTNVGSTKREALLMVDLGASGIDIIFHSKAVRELGLQDLPKAGAIQLRVCSFHCRGISCTACMIAQTQAEDQVKEAINSSLL